MPEPLQDADDLLHIRVDYSQIGLADSFELPILTAERARIEEGVRVVIIGDAVPDRFAVVTKWDLIYATFRFETSLPRAATT